MQRSQHPLPGEAPLARGVRGGGSSILFQEWERAGLLDTKGWPNGFGTGTRLSQRMNARRGFGLKRPQVSRGRSQDTSVQRKAKHTPVNAPLCPSGETPPPGPPEAPGSCGDGALVPVSPQPAGLGLRWSTSATSPQHVKKDGASSIIAKAPGLHSCDRFADCSKPAHQVEGTCAERKLGFTTSGCSETCWQGPCSDLEQVAGPLLLPASASFTTALPGCPSVAEIRSRVSALAGHQKRRK